MTDLTKLPPIPAEKFEFVGEDVRRTDKKFEDKPIGYFKDAWLRFCKNKASIVAAVIIAVIILYALIVPLLGISLKMDTYYAKKGPRNEFLSKFGIAKGTVMQDYNENGYMNLLGIGVGVKDAQGTGDLPLSEGIGDELSAAVALKGTNEFVQPWGDVKVTYTAEKDDYLSVGFLYVQVEQAEYDRIVAWQEETGVRVLYPMVDTNSDYCFNKSDANWWYKTNKKGAPVHINAKGKAVVQTYSDDLVLEDNYLRDADGNVRYWIYSGGGTLETAQKTVRVFYYNYYQYLNGHTPQYLFGTDSQGYDLALRLASGIRLSLMIAVFVSVLNFILGAIYGAIEGYYGGAADMIMERVSDILSNVPFVVVATLFQLHLAKKVGPIPSLLFAFVATGWLGTAYRVRTQFYRFKNQEFVMAARTLGAKDRRIIWKHVFPNSLGTIITSSALVIPGVVFSESMLSFLGIVNLSGAKTTSLGSLLSAASSIWTSYPHLMIFPAVVISLLMICFNLFGNGLRDAFNPSLRGVED